MYRFGSSMCHEVYFLVRKLSFDAFKIIFKVAVTKVKVVTLGPIGTVSKFKFLFNPEAV